MSGQRPAKDDCLNLAALVNVSAIRPLLFDTSTYGWPPLMSKLSLKAPLVVWCVRSGGLAVLGASVAGCVAQVGIAGPPRPTYYAPAVVEVQVREAPPPLPDYAQPPCPEDGYLWTPGYWAWAGADYYWVPGTWVQPPQGDVLWTPGYWGFAGGVYAFHVGYWGPHVGFYGGVNYGFGYTGIGFAGGAWQGNHYAYNRAVTNVNVTVVHNTYNTTVINNVTVNKVSYNGGAGGIAAAPSAQERQFAHEQHIAPTAMQQQHTRLAAQNPALFARANGGRPAIAATPRPAAFNAPGVVGARGAAATFGGRPPQPNIAKKPVQAQPPKIQNEKPQPKKNEDKKGDDASGH
jgi:hypothetical protein